MSREPDAGAPRICVVVASATGRTRRLADAFAAGARSASARVTLLSADEADRDALLGADAIALGSGVHMGGIESSMRAFFERTTPLWLEGALRGRLGAVFASAGDGVQGGGELALLSLLAYLAENGLLLVPMHNRLPGFREGGCHWGPLVRTNPLPGTRGPGPSEAQLEAAHAHGRHVAECTARWLAGAGRVPA